MFDRIFLSAYFSTSDLSDSSDSSNSSDSNDSSDSSDSSDTNFSSKSLVLAPHNSYKTWASTSKYKHLLQIPYAFPIKSKTHTKTKLIKKVHLKSNKYNNKWSCILIHDYILFLSWRHEPWKRHIPTACPMGPLPRGGAAPAGPPGAPPGGPRYGHGAGGAAPGPQLTAKPHALDTHSRPGAHLTLVRCGSISFPFGFKILIC